MISKYTGLSDLPEPHPAKTSYLHSIMWAICNDRPSMNGALEDLGHPSSVWNIESWAGDIQVVWDLCFSKCREPQTSSEPNHICHTKVLGFYCEFCREMLNANQGSTDNVLCFRKNFLEAWWVVRQTKDVAEQICTSGGLKKGHRPLRRITPKETFPEQGFLLPIWR